MINLLKNKLLPCPAPQDVVISDFCILRSLLNVSLVQWEITDGRLDQLSIVGIAVDAFYVGFTLHQFLRIFNLLKGFNISLLVH